MTHLGVTGHQGLAPDVVSYATPVIERLVVSLGHPLRVVSSLAGGADQLVARIAVARGAELEVIVPADDYLSTFDAATVGEYESLLASAHDVTRLDFRVASEEAFFAAGAEVIARSDRLVALWDGKPARGLGGTADVVGLARDAGIHVDVIWPPGAIRT